MLEEFHSAETSSSISSSSQYSICRKIGCTKCTRSWNFATMTAFRLSIQKTSSYCERLVKAAIRSWTRLFSSKIFRAITDEEQDCEKISSKGRIIFSKRAWSTYSLNYRWPSAARLEHIVLRRQLIHPFLYNSCHRMEIAHISFHLSNSGLHILQSITFRVTSRRTFNKGRNRSYLQSLHRRRVSMIEYLLSRRLYSHREAHSQKQEHCNQQRRADNTARIKSITKEKP